ncbi:unnamed protein product [Orchesella dallaii]|uniref:EF-hand domain-containing protein n=1 Tax=Orchesella dallaii TaxID=48710 RepID=A0ABP1QI97_9HEXA
MKPKQFTQICFLSFALLLVFVQVKCQDDVAEQEAPMAPAGEDVSENETEGRSFFGSIRKRAEHLMDAITHGHAGDPKDVLELAKRTLEKAFKNFNGGKDVVPVAQLLSVVELAGGEERMHTIRILELMDKDMDGDITKDEFVQLYAAPMAYPDKALELMHRSYDLDGNGFISQWERLTHLLTLEGINQNVYDKYSQAVQTGLMQDGNSDGLTSLTEFMLYMVWQINMGMEEGKHRDKIQLFSTDSQPRNDNGMVMEENGNGMPAMEPEAEMEEPPPATE